MQSSERPDSVCVAAKWLGNRSNSSAHLLKAFPLSFSLELPAMSSEAKTAESKSKQRQYFTRYSLALFLLIATVLVLVAGLRTGAGNPDFKTYKLWYSENLLFQEYLANPILIFQKDPGYFFISSIFYNLRFSFETFFLIFSGIFVLLKMRGIALLSNSPLISALVYASSYFLLQEMVQVRAGAATCIFLFSIPYLVERKIVAYLFLVMLATCFHYSSFILAFLVFLRKGNECPRWYLSVLIVCVLGAASGVTLDSVLFQIPWLNVDPRFALYVNENEIDFLAMTLFNRVSILNLFLCLILLINFEKIKTITPYASYIIRIFAIAHITYFALSGFPVFAFRLSELMGIVGIIAWPLCFQLIRPTWLRFTFITAVIINYYSAAVRLFA
ncbi:MAG: EpsG family protein [Desulfuromonadales bacterium]